MPISETLRQRPPSAAVFTPVNEGVQEGAVFNFDISPLHRQQPGNPRELFFT
jgi:hypothetical protein